jgi:hypothetical protein
MAELGRVMRGLGSVRRMAAIALLLSLVSGAEAATVSLAGGLQATLDGRNAEAWAKVDPTRSTALPQGAAWAPGALNTSVWMLPSTDYPIAPTGGNPVVAQDPCRNACSPFYGGVYENKGPAIPSASGWEETPFWVVFDPHTSIEPWTNTAELRFTGKQSALSLLWGSPDGENMIEFLLGGASVGTFWGAEFGWFLDNEGKPLDIVQGPGRGAALLTLSGIIFDRVRFTAWSDTGSFEISNLSAVAVPVPASLFLLLSGLGAAAMVGRRRHRT